MVLGLILVVLMASCNTRSVKSTVEEADKLVQAQKTDEALIVYQKGIQSHPTSSILYLNQAALFREKQKFDHAIRNYKVVMGLNPETFWSYVGLARVYLAQTKWDEAKKILEEGQKKFSDNSYLVYFLGRTYVALQDNAKALDFFTRAIDQKLPEPEVHYDRARVYDEVLRDKEKALADYEKYLTLGGKKSAEAFVRINALKNSGYDF
jgi:tetratricopeptide (TPR) repeat protein